MKEEKTELSEKNKQRLWNMMSTQRSLERLEKFIELDAPTVILQNEIKLLKDRMLRCGLLLHDLNS